MFAGFGSVVNAAAITAGGLAGMLAGKLIKDRYRETILRMIGFGVAMMAVGSTLARMLTVKVEAAESGFTASLDTQGAIMMIVSLALGALIGEIINLDGAFERLGAFLRDKTGSKKDGGFVDAFMTASLTVCVGAMAVMGALEEGLHANADILLSKSVIDLITVFTLSASMGKGCIFSAVPVLILQGGITLLAGLLTPVMTPEAVGNLGLVGNVLIVCVGVNMIFPKIVRVANALPAIVIAVAFAFI